MSVRIGLALYQPVQAVAVAAQPKCAVAGLTERRDLVYDARVWLIQFVRDGIMLEWPVSLSSGVEVHPDNALHTAHPEVTITVDDGSYASRYAATALKRFFDPSSLEIIEEQAGIATYP